jgi:hypothetical protein
MERTEIIELWAERVIMIWMEKCYQMKLHFSYQLMESFRHEMITASGGNIAKVVFAFNYYGKFADMGVGRGVKIADRGMSNRKAKPWLSQTFLLEVRKLGHILARDYADQAMLYVVENFDDYGKKWSESKV